MADAVVPVEWQRVLGKSRLPDARNIEGHANARWAGNSLDRHFSSLATGEANHALQSFPGSGYNDGWSHKAKKGVATMRLSEEQVKQGILHDDPLVRFAALDYFAEAFSRDASVMPVVIEALERFGRTNAFLFAHPIVGLAQTPETIAWAITELQRTADTSEASRELKGHLAKLLCKADPELILPHETEILDALGFKPELRQGFSRRLHVHAMDDEACWRELEAICEAGKSKVYAHEARFSEGQQLAQTLARRGDRYADRMMALLAVKIDDFENNPMRWMEPLMVYMAGEMRHEPAVPLIVGKLHEDGEVLNEECMYALTKIGSDSVIRSIDEAFSTAEWSFRLFASDVLGHVHSDLAVEVCGELLGAEEDYEIRSYLAVSLAEQFSTEGNELARQVVLGESGDPFDLKEALLASCTLLGQDFPELAKWRREMSRSRQQSLNWGRRTSQMPLDVQDTSSTRRFDDVKSPSPATVRSQKGPGRNDPCPCGSGKKYKQCCMRKQSVL